MLPAMRDFLEVLVPSLFGFILLIGFAAILGFCWKDANRRGKSPLLVCLLVLFSFPVGLIVWLLFRPEPVPPPFSSPMTDQPPSL